MKFIQTEVNMHNVRDKEKVHKVVTVENKSTRFFQDGVNNYTISISTWIDLDFFTLHFLLCIFSKKIKATEDLILDFSHSPDHSHSILPGDLSILQI